MLADLLAWYNIVFVAAAAIALVFTFLSAMAIGGHGGAHVDSDADLDVDANIDADADVDADGDFEVDGHVDADLDAVHAGPEGLMSLLVFFGLGKVPFSALIVIFGYTFALTGFVANRKLIPTPESAAVYFPISLVIALGVSLTWLRFVSGLMGRYLPTIATAVVPPRKLVGLKGQASLPINERVGEVQVYDRYGTLHGLNCRVRPKRAQIAKGAKVILVQYVAKEHFYYVSPSR